MKISLYYSFLQQTSAKHPPQTRKVAWQVRFEIMPSCSCVAASVSVSIQIYQFKLAKISRRSVRDLRILSVHVGCGFDTPYTPYLRQIQGTTHLKDRQVLGYLPSMRSLNGEFDVLLTINQSSSEVPAPTTQDYTSKGSGWGVFVVKEP